MLQAEEDELIVVGDEGSRTLEHGLHHCDQRGVRTDAEREDADDDRHRELVPAEISESKVQVTSEVVDPPHPACIARLLLEDGDVPELAAGGEACVVSRHAASGEAFGGAIEVVAHLGLHVALERVAFEHGAQTEQHPTEKDHGLAVTWSSEWRRARQKIAPSCPAVRRAVSGRRG